MAYPQGINFRATLGFVTDGAGESMEGGASYPRTTAQGNTVGWEQPVGNTRDRVSTGDRRLAGINFTTGVQTDFRFDLPSAGSYNIRAAFGDMSSVNSTLWTLLDGTSTIATLATGNNSAAGSFKDATDTVLTAAAWPAGNTAITKTFSTTICRFRSSAAGSANLIAHAYVESAGASPDVTVALTGQAATASRGTISPATSKAATGNAATASAGTVRAAPSVALVGTAATSSTGTLTHTTTVALTGGAATAAGGTLTASSASNVTVALSGQSVTATAGALLPASAKGLTGSAASTSSGNMAPTTAISTTGNAATMAQGLLVVTGHVTVALTGQAMTAAQGAMAVPSTGPDVVGYTIMRADPINAEVAALIASIAQRAGTLHDAIYASTILRATATNNTSAMDDDALNQTVEFI